MNNSNELITTKQARALHSKNIFVPSHYITYIGDGSIKNYGILECERRRAKLSRGWINVPTILETVDELAHENLAFIDITHDESGFTAVVHGHIHSMAYNEIYGRVRGDNIMKLYRKCIDLIIKYL